MGSCTQIVCPQNLSSPMPARLIFFICVFGKFWIIFICDVVWSILHAVNDCVCISVEPSAAWSDCHRRQTAGGNIPTVIFHRCCMEIDYECHFWIYITYLVEPVVMNFLLHEPLTCLRPLHWLIQSVPKTISNLPRSLLWCDTGCTQNNY